MTSRAITFAQIECDSCGTRRDSVTDRDAISARISASRDGWKYVAWDIKGKGLQQYNRERAGGTSTTVPRQWDCCPECPLPESPVEASQIRDTRMVRNRSGRWIDRESA